MDEWTMTWNDGKEYVGDFKADQMLGKGTVTIPDGVVYIGGFKNNPFAGQGDTDFSRR